MKKSPTGLVYLASTTASNKIYIGITRNYLCNRKYQHSKDASRGSKSHFHNAIRKYGIDTFKFTPIACPIKKEYLGDLEIILISQYDTYNNGYNSSTGGEGADKRRMPKSWRMKIKAIRNSKESRKLNSQINKAKMKTEKGKAHQAKMVELARTDEARKKLSKAAKHRLTTIEGWLHHSEISIKGANASKEKFSKRVFVDGVEYPSVTEASRQSGLSRSHIRYRIKSPNFADYYFL